jgi:pyruvate dehydrogenase E1 component alpha subunit
MGTTRRRPKAATGYLNPITMRHPHFRRTVNEPSSAASRQISMLHMSIGEEAVTGVVNAMEPGDTFTTHHRGHGIFNARGADPKR